MVISSGSGVSEDFIPLEALARHGHLTFFLIPFNSCCVQQGKHPNLHCVSAPQHTHIFVIWSFLQSLQDSEDLGLHIMVLVQVIGENKNKGLTRRNWLFLPAILIEEEH